MNLLFLNLLPDEWENKIISLISFLVGTSLQLFIPKWRINLFIENLLLPILFRRISTYNPLTIRRQRRKIEDSLVRLGELFNNEGPSHVSIFFLYKRKNQIHGSMVYEVSINEKSLGIIGSNYKSGFKHLNYETDPRIKAMWDYVMSEDFPGYLTYYNDTTAEGENQLDTKYSRISFETTLLIPKYDRSSNKIYFHLNLGFLNRPKDPEAGKTTPITVSPYQEKRMKQILNEVHSLLTSY